ncbi:MAG: aldo/keto reductase [Planctomycetaceae bacterium]|jgi:predicted aldo/keto reductase-like oxidoreductase|nr:aldo/keto reductase [Planctomycetaceae bacterium]
MQYRSFTKDKIQISALGFGCMRFPLLKGGTGEKPDEKEAVRMLRYAIDHGVNYIDTAAPYHGGESETVVGKALRDGYREKVILATKFPTWEPTAASELDPILERQLQKLGVDCLDVYLIHNIQKSLWKNVQKLKMIDWVEKKRQQGKLRYVGFSFHDDFDLFKTVLDCHDWDVCQIQYNYTGENVQAGTKGLNYAGQKGVSVVIMEPLFGGVLAKPPGLMGETIRKSGKNPVDLALRWLWDKPEVSVVLSGMSSMEQTVENVQIAGKSGVGTLSAEDRAVIEAAKAAYEKSSPVKCTKCKYCLPCPFEVDIPRNFEHYNNAFVLSENTKLCRILYSMLPEPHRAANCTECGACETKCPQHLPIRRHLKEVVSLLG